MKNRVNPGIEDKISRARMVLIEGDPEIASQNKELFLMRKIISGTYEGLWLFDVKDEKVYVNDQWIKMMGYEVNEVDLNMNLWMDWVHEEDKGIAIRSFMEKLENVEPSEFYQIFRLKHKAGNYCYIRSRANFLYDEEGNLEYIVGTHKDVSEEIKAKKELEEAKEKYYILYQNSQVVTVITEASTGKILEANRRFYQLTGADKDSDEVYIQNFYHSPEDRKRFLEKLYRDGRVEDFELEIRTVWGGKLYGLVSATLNKDKDRLDAVISDITELKKSMIELEQVNYELDRFVYHASHDLRSPLKSVLGLVNLLRKDEDPEIQAKCVDEIENSVKRLDDLVGDLLHISRNSRLDIKKERIHLQVEVNQAIAVYGAIENMKNLQVFSHIREIEPFYSDPPRVRIVLNNIISNALKYRRDIPDSYIRITAVVTEKEAVITIEDNGEGIPENKIDGIFDMFSRATEKSSGSGLGLYLVDTTIDKLNGTIEVESEEGKGTTFKVVIPNHYSDSI
ncbi:PAS domain-containing sensor histidine kinase [Marinigracilibium pacificum]|uniref:histidine kinase n=1 Tax=Marinigracilibium pacificum TaxID=2729599 RepID=A0A848J5J0_9BACT|nr:ATP-binding protein [Marinigracilibium pacificum]NMM49629.1 PAS domain-containing protein [Marinigracilibium pacificum]